MEKNEILANMYALRAGLSVVAVNSDKINNKLVKAKNKAENDEQAARDAKARVIAEVSDKRNEIAKLNGTLEKRKDRRKKAVADGAKNTGMWFALLLWNIVCLAASLALIGTLVYIIVFWIMTAGVFGDPPTSDFVLALYGWTFKYIVGPEDWFMWTAIGCSAVSLGLAFLGVALLIHSIGELRWNFSIKRNGKDAGDDMPKSKKIKKKIDSLTESVALSEAALPAYDSDIKKAIADGKEHIAQTCVSLAPLCSSTMALYDMLKTTFSPFLDERDWIYLDILTYYVETGRADTVKESLHLLDEQRRTNQLVDAVKKAAGAICHTVNKGLNVLQNDMRKCFNILSEQINEVGSMVYSVTPKRSTFRYGQRRSYE